MLDVLARRVRRADLTDADLWVSAPLPGREWAQSSARRLWLAQMRHARVRPGRPGRQTHGPRIRAGDACILGLVLTRPCAQAGGLAGMRNAEAALCSLAGGAAPEVLYFYYGPEPGQPLTQEAAAARFSRLRDALGPPRRPLLDASPLVLALLAAALAVAVVCRFHA